MIPLRIPIDDRIGGGCASDVDRRDRAHRGPARPRAAGARRRGDRALPRPRARGPGAPRHRAGGGAAPPARKWDPPAGPAPAGALGGRDAVVPLAGERVDQRWTDDARRAILESRAAGTRHLVDGLRAADPRPGALVSSSAVGWYGARGDEIVDEAAPAGDGFLAGVCAVWEREAAAAEELGMRVVRVRTGVVLDREGGALARMLTPFRLGVGGR